MKMDESLDGESITLESTVSETHPPIAIHETIQRETENQQDSKTSITKSKTTNVVPFYKLFSFADSLDHVLMFVGTIGAIGNGLATPLMNVVFGNLIDAFGRATNPREVVHDVSKVLNSLHY
jgi:hypothetical protein